jgi:WD40 repeat protein
MAVKEEGIGILKYLRSVLESPTPHTLQLPGEIMDELLRNGAILKLQNDGSTEAVLLLERLAGAASASGTLAVATSAIIHLAEGGSTLAIDALYRLALDESNAGLRQHLSTQNWRPSKPSVKVLLDWLSGSEGGKDERINLSLLTQAYFEDAAPALKDQILYKANTPRFRNWSRMIAALEQADPPAMHELLTIYPNLSQQEQSLCLQHLTMLAPNNQYAQEEICQLFIQYDDQPARDIAQKHHYLPAESYAQALYFFLSGDQEQYQVLDFNHNLLVTAYEVSSRTLRRRLLTYSRQTGRVDWLQAVNQGSSSRWLSDLTDADWKNAIQRLFAQERHQEMWRLAQVAPPIVSVDILARLHQAGWQPSPDDREGYHQLVTLALECWSKPLGVKPTKKLSALSDDFLCLQFHPQASLLAAGSRGQPIYLWSIPEGDLQFPALVGPASTTRAIQFSQDGELIIAANGDQRIRILRHHTGQLIKTLEGHRSLIRALAMHPGGRILVSAGFDGSIRFWRIPIGTELKHIQSDVTEIFSLAMLGSGEMLASGGAGENISIWSVPEGNFLRSLPVGSEGILHLAAPASSDLLAGAGRNGALHVWNAVNGNPIRTFSPLPFQITGLQFHPNEHFIIIATSTGLIHIINLSNGETLMTLKGHSSPITSITLSSGGQQLASADAKGTVILWSLSTMVWLNTPYHPGSSFPLAELTDRLLDRSLPDPERSWLSFTAALWKWIRRFEIEISEPLTIALGEFDIEL